MHDTILILDFGSQVTQLIARRVRESKVYSEIWPYDSEPERIKTFVKERRCKGIILSGGPSSVTEPNSPRAPEIVFQLNVPVLGICYGMQTMAAQLGGQVASAESLGKAREFGYAEVRARGHTDLLNNIEDHRTAEGCHADWVMGDYIAEAVSKIKEQVGNDEVILGLSGGVDSSVAAALIHRAIGPQLTCVFVDHGLLRLHEGKMVMDMFARNLGVKVIHVDAAHEFLSQLKGVTDPEQKRKIIGKEFVEVFQRESGKIKNAKWLAQGTIYPDVIESAGKGKNSTHTIKSHHNVGGLPEDMHLQLLEPLRELFKDEVRALGVELGLPKEMVDRHPFPGPGLGVRILGEVKPEFADLLRRADAIFIEELRNTIDPNTKQSWYALTSQAFAVFWERMAIDHLLW
ncbi:MAG: glutamine-hydrolyzing GMP synthase [Burkholderiaceae bacterium]|nr:glutamine-hydrolyzing GMP synthase [Burkholderiaceae bacterium]